SLFQRVPDDRAGVHQNHDIASQSFWIGLVTSCTFDEAASSCNCFLACSLFCTGGVNVARIRPFDVTVTCSPFWAFSRYFNRLALKSLMFTVSMPVFPACTKMLYKS